jgi:guanine deaminase
MSDILIRGRLLWFLDFPLEDDPASYKYIEDGAILVSGGRIKATGTYSEVSGKSQGVPVADHRPNLILPGFIDPHIHFPQVQVIGSYGAQLLDWLNTYTFPEELKYSDPGHAKRMSSHFFDELIRHGTTTAVAFCTAHKTSAEAFFAEAQKRSMCMIGGKVMMDRNAPEALCDTPQQSYDDSKALIAEWHGRDRLHYAITPRFAITSSEAQMQAAGALMAEFPDLHMQTHLSENRAECEFSCSLFPFARDYTDIYEHYGMLGPKSLFGHCIHLSDRETGVLAETSSVAVFNPTSNLFLGSGLFDLERLRAAGVRDAVATDVGGGTSYSMLRTMDEAYKILQLQGQKLPPLMSYYMMTLGNARALGLESRIGQMSVGADADLVVLDSRATPAMALRSATLNTLAEELFVLQTMGDDRSVAETYVAGTPAKSTLAA